MSRLRLLPVGLHLLSGACQAALLFRFVGETGRRRLTQVWSRQMLALLGIKVEAGDGLRTIDAGLLVGNHISFIDIFVINALLPSVFVAKSEVARWPLIGTLCRNSGTVFIERGSHKAAHRTRQHLLEALCAGRRLAIFPEGTSTAGDSLLPFHGALFQGAIDAAVPVHALALSYHAADGARSKAPAYFGDISLLECLMRVLQADGLVARISLAESFPPPLPDRRELARKTHRAVAAALTGVFHATPTPSRAIHPDPENRGQNPSTARA